MSPPPSSAGAYMATGEPTARSGAEMNWHGSAARPSGGPAPQQAGVSIDSPSEEIAPTTIGHSRGLDLGPVPCLVVLAFASNVGGAAKLEPDRTVHSPGGPAGFEAEAGAVEHLRRSV